MSHKESIADYIAKDIREAFLLLKESSSSYKYGDVNLNNAIIVTSNLSEIAYYTEIIGMKVFVCDLQSSFDYFICIHDASFTEEKFLTCHRKAMESR